MLACAGFTHSEIAIFFFVTLQWIQCRAVYCLESAMSWNSNASRPARRDDRISLTDLSHSLALGPRRDEKGIPSSISLSLSFDLRRDDIGITSSISPYLSFDPRDVVGIPSCRPSCRGKQGFPVLLFSSSNFYLTHDLEAGADLVVVEAAPEPPEPVQQGHVRYYWCIYWFIYLNLSNRLLAESLIDYLRLSYKPTRKRSSKMGRQFITRGPPISYNSRLLVTYNQGLFLKFLHTILYLWVNLKYVFVHILRLK